MSDSLRMHKDSGTCQGAQINLSDSDEKVLFLQEGLMIMEMISFANTILMNQ